MSGKAIRVCVMAMTCTNDSKIENTLPQSTMIKLLFLLFAIF